MYQTEFDSAPDTHHVVEEPAELLDVASPASQTEGLADTTSQLLQQGAPSVKGDYVETDSCEEETVTGILSQLAESATAFLSAIQSLARQSASSNTTVRQQLERLQGSFEQLGARHEAGMGTLSEEVRARTDNVSRRLEEMSARVVRHQEEFAGLHAKVESLMPLHSVVSDLSSKMTVWSERLNQQEDVLHSLCQMQTQRAAALKQFCEVLARLETSHVPPSAMP